MGAGGNATVLCPGGVGASEAAAIAGVAKVISVEGDCFSAFDGGSWASALGSVAEGRIFAASTATGREIAARMGASKGVAVRAGRHKHRWQFRDTSDLFG